MIDSTTVRGLGAPRGRSELADCNPSRHPVTQSAADSTDWTPRKYCSCGYNKFVFLMYQVGAGTSMFALGKTLSLFCKTAESLRFCSRFMLININTNYSRSSKSSMRIIFIVSAHLFAIGIGLCRLSVLFSMQK